MEQFFYKRKIKVWFLMLTQKTRQMFWTIVAEDEAFGMPFPIIELGALFALYIN
jgi:hypothetical protein